VRDWQSAATLKVLMAHHTLKFQPQPDSHVHVPYVSTLQVHDVVLGRGAAATRWPGNVRFRKLIGNWKEQYTQTGRHHTKKVIAHRIYEEIQRRGGRFLRHIDSMEEAQIVGVPVGMKAWAIVDENVAMRKIKQALREYPTRLVDSDDDKDHNDAAASKTDCIILEQEEYLSFSPVVPDTSTLVPPIDSTCGLCPMNGDPTDRKLPRHNSWSCLPDRVEGIKRLHTSLQNTGKDAVSALRRPQKRKAEDSCQQNVTIDGTRKGCTIDEVPNEAFANIPLAHDHVWKSFSPKQSTHTQQGPLIGYPSRPMDSSYGDTSDSEPFELRGSVLDSGNCYQSQGQYNHSTTPLIESLDDSLYLLRPIEEICLFGAVELDESITSLLSIILSHPETNA
jgi:hypothetical protein